MAERVDPAGLTVFVTGASSGFGAAMVRRFAQAGAKVVAAARRAERLEALVAECAGGTGGKGGRVHPLVLPLVLDVCDRAAVEAAVASLPAPFAAPDVLVNNAGLALGLEPVEQTKLADWEAMVATNINGLLYCTRALLPGMMERDRGHVVNISSIAGSYPYPGGNVYGGTKAFVRQFSLGLRCDLAGRNIRVTSLEPGKARTEFSLVRFGGDEKREAAAYEGYRPLGGEDVAECVFWAVTLPRHININAMEVMPVTQTFADFPVTPVPGADDGSGPSSPG